MIKLFIHNKIKFICLALPAIIISIYIFEIKNCAFSLFEQTFESYTFYANGTDMADYFKNAIEFYQGQWPKQTFYRAPLYSLFLIFIYFFTKNVFSVIIIQGIMLLSTTYITYLITKTIFGKKAALLSSMLLTFYSGFIFWIAIPHSTVLETTLTTISFLTLIKLRKKFNNRNIFIAGITGATLCLVRPNFLIIVPPAIFFIAIEQLAMHMKKNSRNKYKTLKTLCLGALVFLFPLLPFIIWNNLHSDTFVIFTTNGTKTFNIANSYDSCIYNFIYPKLAPIPLFSIAFIKHQVMKFIAFWNSVEFPQNVNFYIYQSKSLLLTLLPVNFGIIGALFIAATFFFISSWKKYWLFLWFIWSYIITIVIFFIIGRFRIPIVPLMVILNSAFIIKIIQYFKISKKHKTLIKPKSKLKIYLSLMLFFIVLILSSPPGYYIQQHDWINISNKCLYAMDLAGYSNALEQKEVKKDASTILNISASETFQGHFCNAEAYINILLKNDPDNTYFKQTQLEILLLKQIKKGSIPQNIWHTYITKTQNKAHIARFYNTLTSIIRKRKEFGLSTNREWIFQQSFFLP